MPDAPAPGRRAVVYARYSSDLQSDRSIDDQVALCRAHALREGLTVGRVYADHARTSASLHGRDGILELMVDAKARAFDAVVVESLDRISRDQEDLTGVFKRLDFAGIAILAVHDGRADAVQVGLRGLMGGLFLADLKHKTRRGLQGVIRDGRCAGGRSYGYARVPGQPGVLTIVGHEAETIRRIFALYADGTAPRTIAGLLNADGVPAPRGIRWNASTFNGSPERGYGLLRNPLYQGRIAWNRVRMVRDPDTGRRVNRENPPEQWQWAEAPHLRIVPPALWDRVQARLEAQSRGHPARMDRAPRRPFSGLVRCGSCGGAMVVHDRAGAAVRIRCATARESGSCANTARYRIDRIEAAIFADLRDRLAHPRYLAEFVRAHAEERRRIAAEARRDVAALDRAAATTAARYARLVDMYARGLTDGPAAEADILAAKAAMREAEAARAEAGRPEVVVALHPATVATYAAALDTLSAHLAMPGTPFDPRAVQALRTLISAIVVHKPAAGEDAAVDVHGRLAALLGPDADKVGGVVVARGGLEPPTPRL